MDGFSITVSSTGPELTLRVSRRTVIQTEGLCLSEGTGGPAARPEPRPEDLYLLVAIGCFAEALAAAAGGAS